MRINLTALALLVSTATIVVSEEIPLVPSERSQPISSIPILEEGEILLVPTSNSRGEWFYVIDRTRLENLPALDPTYPDPPLSIRDAIEEAVRSLKDRYPEIQNLTLNQVQFRKGSYPSGQVWHYDVWFYAEEGPDSERDIFSVLVPMDGKALVPRPRENR